MRANVGFFLGFRVRELHVKPHFPSLVSLSVLLVVFRPCLLVSVSCSYPGSTGENGYAVAQRPQPQPLALPSTPSRTCLVVVEAFVGPLRAWSVLSS
jgi:hypothetical protein